MNDDSIDFSPLDPTRDANRFDGLASAITRDAMAARARAPVERADIFAGVAGWSRPALLAAAIVLAIALPALAHFRATGASAQPRRVSATEVMGVPPELIDLLHSSRTPSLSDLHSALADAGAR